MDVDRAIKLAQELRSLILQGFKADKEDEAYEKSDKSISDFFKESNGTDVSTTDLLALIDNLIYSLMSYTPDEENGWADEEEYEERTQMKLKEVVPPSVFPL